MGTVSAAKAKKIGLMKPSEMKNSFIDSTKTNEESAEIKATALKTPRKFRNSVIPEAGPKSSDVDADPIGNSLEVR